MVMSGIRRYSTSIILLVILSSLTYENAKGIPVFARKYGISCSTCHVAIAKLNSFGDAFRYNGYRFPLERRAIIEEKPVPLGGKPHEKEWPSRAIWPGEIPGVPPIAFRALMDIDLDSDSDYATIFSFPKFIFALSGGNLGESVSYFINIMLIRDGKFGGLSRAFIQFDSPIWNNKMLNVKLGKFEIAAVPISRIRRITALSTNIVNSFKNGMNPLALHDGREGIEIWGIRDGRNGGGLYYAAGIVESKKLSSAKPGSKDVYARLNYKFGGLSLSGESGPVPQGGNWRDDHVRLGGFVYSGQNADLDFVRRGLDLRVQIKDLDVVVGSAFGSDDTSFSSVSEISFSAYFVETTYLFLPWLIGVGRYDIGFTQDEPSSEDIRELLLNLTISVRPNVILRTEVLRKFKDQNSTKVRMRFDFAF